MPGVLQRSVYTNTCLMNNGSRTVGQWIQMTSASTVVTVTEHAYIAEHRSSQLKLPKHQVRKTVPQPLQ